MHRIHTGPLSRSPKFVRPPSNTRSVPRSPQVVRPPSNTRPSTRVDVRGAAPSVQPPISAADIGALMLLGLQNPKSILFTLALAILAQAPGAEAASTPYQHFPAWIKGCSNVPTYGTKGSLNCELDPQLTAGYSLMAAGVIPGHGIFSLKGQLPYASTNKVDTTITIPPSGQVKIDISKPVEPFTAPDKAALAALVALDGCSREHMLGFHLCLVPKDAGPAASLGYDYEGKSKNPDEIVDPQQLADKLNGGSRPKCAIVYRGVDPSVPGTTVTAFGEDLYVHNSCDVAVGPGGPLSSRNVEKLSNGGVRLHFRPVPPSVPTSGPTSGPTSEKWQGAQVSTVRADFKYGNYSMEIGGIPVEQTREEIGIIRSIFLWADQPWLAYLKLGEIFGWPLKIEWRNIQRELDFFEIGKFNDFLHSVAQFAVQHWNVLGNVMPISPNISEAMTYTCEFLKDSITFGLKQSGLETAWRYINQLFIPPEGPGVRVLANIWNSRYKAADPTTHAPSNGIRQWMDIESLTLPPANVSLPPASPTRAPESGASSAISGGGIAGIIVAAVVVVAGLVYARFRRAAAEPQQPARNASVLNDVVIELPEVGDAAPQQPASEVSTPAHVVVDVAAIQEHAIEVAPAPLNQIELQPASVVPTPVSDQVVEGDERQPPAGVASTPVDDQVVVAERQQPASEVSTPAHVVVDVAAIQEHAIEVAPAPFNQIERQQPAGVASTPVPDDQVVVAELPQTAIEASPQVSAQAVEGQDV